MKLNIYCPDLPPSTREVARCLGITVDYLRKIRTGKARPSVKLADKLIAMDPSGTLTYEAIFKKHFNQGATSCPNQ